jgi:cell division septation protein DedD
MASGGKRGAGDRVLESKHVIGLFLLMLLFSGAFFALGYVMARDQYAGQVRAANVGARSADPMAEPKPEPASNKSAETRPATGESDPPTFASDPGWEFSNTSRPSKNEPRLEPAPKAPVTPPASKSVSAKSKVEPPAPTTTQTKGGKNLASAPLIPNGALVIQVAALMKQDDALSIASSLQKKHFAAYVQTPQKDKFYRVQVGPFKDKKAAEAAKKGLESEGFKAFYITH